ncbi:hypothetical protein [Allohahella marinimesophila]|uniref:Pilus formation protein N-terminal domain-containing protein n=1 Tax=Allohahella marinimesophila TaxID=1054972 RepID=A0ABP7NNQ9_9GAMM
MKTYISIVTRLGSASLALALTLLMSSVAVAEEISEAGGIVNAIDVAKNTITILDETLQVDPTVAVVVRGKPVPLMMVLEVGDTVLFKAAVSRGERLIVSASVVKDETTMNAYTR